MFDIHQFRFRFDWTLTGGGTHMKHLFRAVGRATVPANIGRHGGRPYFDIHYSIFIRLAP
jgi:hypothetical protein